MKNVGTPRKKRISRFYGLRVSRFISPERAARNFIAGRTIFLVDSAVNERVELRGRSRGIKKLARHTPSGYIIGERRGLFPVMRKCETLSVYQSRVLSLHTFKCFAHFFFPHTFLSFSLSLYLSVSLFLRSHSVFNLYYDANHMHTRCADLIYRRRRVPSSNQRIPSVAPYERI